MRRARTPFLVPHGAAAAGLQVVEVDARIHLAPGGSKMARMMGVSMRALADKYIATGETCEADIEHYIQNTHNDHFWTVYYSTISVIAKKQP